MKRSCGLRKNVNKYLGCAFSDFATYYGNCPFLLFHIYVILVHFHYIMQLACQSHDEIYNFLLVSFW